ncbi:Sodium bicarbonate cotransporter [Enhygromyxa salina]|uniref:Sodium bicarbonate cotransporter n=1 Tax=Enhygromyxa salina TaxID=215803 RepID=A0A0C2CZ00_9BACT|nr:sodium bicarbonate transporter family protein [Enhygromyxa salina]KIG13092.1 Sodium bicarbonate cotransporter [Enhygromyxa salina]
MAKDQLDLSEDDGMTRTGRLAGGLRNDLRRRLPHYLSDWRDGLHPKVAGSTLFLFFACLANAIAFGGLTGLVTGGEIGTLEMIVATAAGGIAFALFSGQPLTILGGTGPIVIFTGLLYTTCGQLGLPFLPVYAWVGLWSGLILLLLAITDASFLMRYFTRFTDEIFAALIAVIFIVEAVKSVVVAFTDEGSLVATGLLSLILAVGTYLIARSLKGFLHTPFLHRRVRELVSDFGPALAIGVMTGFALLFPYVELEVAAIPETLSTTTGRPWQVDLLALPTWAIFAAVGPAILATILLFLDQNISTRLVNAKSHKLKKGPGFHLDLAVVGVITGVCSIFGLPWIVAATVHALNHVKSLATTEIVADGGAISERIVSVRENRVSPFMIHVLIAGSILILPLIKLIPMPVLFGLFLYMGFATLTGNELADRAVLWFTDRNLYPETHYLRRVSRRKIHLFTIIQLGGLVALWVLKTSPLGLLFPILIALLVPLRLALKRWFTDDELEALDGEETAEDVEIDHMLAGDLHA